MNLTSNYYYYNSYVKSTAFKINMDGIIDVSWHTAAIASADMKPNENEGRIIVRHMLKKGDQFICVARLLSFFISFCS